jgi:hypothetical protein
MLGNGLFAIISTRPSKVSVTPPAQTIDSIQAGKLLSARTDC